MTNLSGAYGMVGSVLNELRGELVTFQLFVEWYCKELDLVSAPSTPTPTQPFIYTCISLSHPQYISLGPQRHYKDEYDRANPETPEKMPKATFKEILTQMDIKWVI